MPTACFLCGLYGFFPDQVLAQCVQGLPDVMHTVIQGLPGQLGPRGGAMARGGLPANPLTLARMRLPSEQVWQCIPELGRPARAGQRGAEAPSYQDGRLLQLLVQGVAVIRIAVERPGTHDQVALERAGNAHLHPELVRLPGLAFADAVHLGRMPGVELGQSIGGFALAALVHDAPGFVQGLTQRMTHGRPDGTGLAVNLALQPSDDGALALDGAAHALELAGMGVAPGLAA